MKNKILTFIIGVLVGAIITTAGFLIYEKVNNNSSSMPNGERPQMMEGENGGIPPEKPDGETGKNNNGTPPEMPSKDNSSSESN